MRKINPECFSARIMINKPLKEKFQVRSRQSCLLNINITQLTSLCFCQMLCNATNILRAFEKVWNAIFCLQHKWLQFENLWFLSVETLWWESKTLREYKATYMYIWMCQKWILRIEARSYVVVVVVSTFYESIILCIR